MSISADARSSTLPLRRHDRHLDGGFAGDPRASTGIAYRVHVEGVASEAELEPLGAHVEDIAEVPSALRRGCEVRLDVSQVVSSAG